MQFERVSVIIAATMLAGCASASGVVAVGPDTYFVSRQAATGLSGLGNLKAEIISEAGQFCVTKGKAVQVVHETESKPPYILGNYPRAEMQFTCV